MGLFESCPGSQTLKKPAISPVDDGMTAAASQHVCPASFCPE
jgi:hypothetical protein